VKAKIKSRASRAAIFERLHRLLGPEAEPIIQRVIERLDSGDTTAGISELKAYDDTIGGYCGMPEEWCKPDGAYRLLGYVPLFIYSRHHVDLSRYVVMRSVSTLRNYCSTSAIWAERFSVRCFLRALPIHAAAPAQATIRRPTVARQRGL
jgi:hypothetical protein